MDTSDSEDDCYGNIAQKLQNMKNRYIEDKIETFNLLNDSTEIDEIMKEKSLPTKRELESIPIRENTVQLRDIDEPELVFNDNSTATSSKRVTRSATKRSASFVECSLPTKSSRRKVGETTRNTSSDITDTSVTILDSPNFSETRSVTRSRGRGRGRGRGRNTGRRGLNSRRNNSPLNFNIPTYSVGNTDEYPDQSDSQTLFGINKIDDVLVIDEETDFDMNEELSVKVHWLSSEVIKFTIRKFQKLVQIFDYFSKKENVSFDRLFMTYNEKILQPDDTPDSINYSIAKFIEGGLINNSVTNLIKDNKETVIAGIKLKFQCQNKKKPFETVVRLNDKLSIAFVKCAEHLETSVNKLKFEFDGDSISGKSTPRDLDLEGGECIDVKIMNM